MTLTIELTPEEETRLQEEATRAGVDTTALVHRLIASGLAAEAEDELLWQQEFERDRDVIVQMAYEAMQEDKAGKTVPLETVLSGKGYNNRI